MYFTKEIIDVQNGSIYINNTRKYLAPLLQTYGDEFMKHIKQCHIISTSIQDYGINTKEECKKIDPNIYILFDVNGPMKFGHYVDLNRSRLLFNETLHFFQQHPAFVYDYPYDSTRDGNKHVVVIKVPHQKKFNLFMKGEYSKMYTQEEMDKLILKYSNSDNEKKDIKTDVYSVLSKDPEYFDKFAERVYEEFGTRINNDGREYDYPISLRKEILRYNDQKQQI